MCTREGTLFKKLDDQPSESGWAPMYYALAGQHLYEYQSKGSAPLKTIHLLGAKVLDDDNGGTNDVLLIISNGRAYTLKMESTQERDDWGSDLREASSGVVEATPAPSFDEVRPPVRRRKGSVSMRAEKKFVDTAMKTKKGREKLKNMIPADSAAMYALNAFTEFTQVDQDEESAKAYERSVLKVIVKAMVLDKYKMLDYAEVSKGLVPLRDLCVSLVSAEKGETELDQARLIRLCDELCGVCVCVLTPHVTPKTIGTMQSVFDYVRNENRFEKLFTKPEYATARQLALRSINLALPQLEDEISERQMQVDRRDRAAMQKQQQSHANSKAAKMLGLGGSAGAGAGASGRSESLSEFLATSPGKQ